MHLTGQELVNWLVEAMETMPGYKEYCGHQEEMQRKAEAWQRWIEKSHYYPYGGKSSSESKAKAKAKAEGFVNGNEAKQQPPKNKTKNSGKHGEKALWHIQDSERSNRAHSESGGKKS